MTKWKVLIADDEFIIREGIRDAVDWEKYNMEVIGEAEDGEEAVEIALKQEIDVLFIDLNMPIMNGIAAMKEIRKTLDCKIIIISGYDNFTYAQEAIRLQVEEYLLKPVNINELENVLINVKEELEEKEKQTNMIAHASTQIKKNYSSIRNHFFQDVFQGKVSEAELMEHLQFLKLPMHIPNYLITVKWEEDTLQKMLLEEKEWEVYYGKITSIIKVCVSDMDYLLFDQDRKWIKVLIWGEITEDIQLDIEKMVLESTGQTVHVLQSPTGNTYANLLEADKKAHDMISSYIQFSPLVKQAIAYIRKHYQNKEINLESIAKGLHVSSVYLSKMIKQELGESYIQILTRLRINKAKQLLEQTDWSIREIAEVIGYDSQHYFSTAFKKMEGVSPIRYKQTCTRSSELN
jgi:two-component system, response regulator YesN